ncbi:LOW QUALITY PROTEIN: proteolipid protein 2-like [Peromyscus leucopus]|uniref:LOW QUALITY PROTEIN: proteolipid protein 2-like n=1 Tax=Peromyscus leucopus TaxID=10041 RepID=UPI00188491A3|nr:LOW QUALITY PROTEIN: proteolipid protein 2-like [Peromyscus leucopus]
MADSERLSAPVCWLACTSFSPTKKGIFLFAEIVLCLVVLICFSALKSAYLSLSVIEIIIAAVLFVFYMCDLHSKISFINWPWTEFFRALIAAILYLITSTVVLVEGKGSSKIAAGVLGIFATLLYGCDAYRTFHLKQKIHTAAPTDPTDGPWSSVTCLCYLQIAPPSKTSSCWVKEMWIRGTCSMGVCIRHFLVSVQDEAVLSDQVQQERDRKLLCVSD